ncbi:MAG: Fur family transcriptional regulator [Dehalogenimonas sp.]|jgi:Fur family ferric uptake transcriptional regulator|uniref:Fur family transcriptional regulator n=1 Tax=Candidatus Dehalogenimonas loeffleri TaxID=3127115 RepID=A0ABZ2J163_9CHLR|nr:Fur family transcriptional regulator [Dehalogenimonas sp.]
MSTQQQLLNQLKTAGYKLTPQRRAVIAALVKSANPVTNQSLHAALKPDHPEIGLVTVYRTMALLDKLGLLCRFNYGDHISFRAGPPEHHHHLVCRGCGNVVDFTDHCPLELQSAVERNTGFRITEHTLEFAGYCRSCQEA